MELILKCWILEKHLIMLDFIGVDHRKMKICFSSYSRETPNMYFIYMYALWFQVNTLTTSVNYNAWKTNPSRL